MNAATKRRFILGIMLWCSLFTNLFAQKTETKISFGSGLFSFAGAYAQNTTFINYDASTKSGYANNPYGSKNGLCYGFSLQKENISKWNLIYGFDLSYEILRSKILINRIYGDSSSAANGKTFLSFGFFNFYPFLGYRLKIKNISIDVTGGFELACRLKTWESGSAKTSNGNEIYTSANKSGSNLFDFRKRIQIACNYRKISPYLGYSVGLVDYVSNMGVSNSAFSRMKRIGIAYRISH
jgi:hypothetical protein